jgi:TPR repeat protein
MSVFRILMVIGFLCLSACASMHNYNLEKGINCFQVQDYRSAFIRLLPEAKAGQPDAMYAIGYMYYYGQGVVENRQKACYWINRAASAGQKDAIHALEILKQGKPI